MKNIKITLLAIVSLLALQACQNDDDIIFEVQQPGEFSFTNTFLSEYILTPQTATNLGERFTWETVDFGVQTNVSYEVQHSVSNEFETITSFGTTTETQLSVSIGDLLEVAEDMGLSNDPALENNQGVIYVRIKAFVGSSGSDEDAYSDIMLMNLLLPETESGEDPTCHIEAYFLVGAGVPDAGWGWESPVVVPCTGSGVFSANVTFSNEGDANFRFFTENANWDSGLNYPWFIDEGYTIDSNFEDAQDDDNNFKFIGESGTYFLEVDSVNKTITLGPPQATGVCELEQYWLVGAGVPDAGWGWENPVQVLCTGEGVFSGNVNFSNEGDANFRFFTENANWDSGRNYPWFVNEGYDIDANFEDAQDGDNNFKFIGESGVYFLTVDEVNKVISLN